MSEVRHVKQNAQKRRRIMPHPAPIGTVGLVVLIALGMAMGCLGGSPTVKYYTFETPASLADNPASGSGRELAVSVGPVHLPGYLDRQQIVTRPGGSRVRYDEFHRWTGVLESEIPRALADNLRILLASDRIVAYPTTATFALDYRVVVEIERLDAALGGDSVLQARWSIQPGGGGDALAVSRSDLKGQVDGSSYENLAAAHSQLLAELSRAIVTKLREIDRAQSEAEDAGEMTAP